MTTNNKMNPKKVKRSQSSRKIKDTNAGFFLHFWPTEKEEENKAKNEDQKRKYLWRAEMKINKRRRNK